MSSLVSARWRMLVAIGYLTGIGTLNPYGVMAQADQPPAPSGASVEVGGVTAQGPGAVEVEGVTAPSALPATGGGPSTAVQPSVAGAQGRPLTLPKTGGGPQQNEDGLLAIVAGLVAIGGGVYLRRRASQH